MRFGSLRCGVTFFFSLVLSSGVAFAQSSSSSPATPNQVDDDRPVLRHNSGPIQETPEPPSIPVMKRRAEPQIAPGLALPNKGHVWALDASVGTQQFTQLRFSPTQLNNHRKQNVAKATLAPFAFKQKATVEVAGASAKVRLHSPATVFYVRSIYSVDDTNTDDETYSEPHLALVKLEVQGDHRIASTIAFGRITQKPSRSEGVIETSVERIGNTGWFKITPMEALAPGEYGLIPRPKTQNTFSTVILDFAVEPMAVGM